MAQRKVKVRECDRCAKATPADATVTFTYQDVTYEIDLCDKHADNLDRDIRGWSRLGREIHKSGFFEDADQWRELLDREAEHRALYPEEPGTSAAYVDVEVDDELPPVFSEWTLTDHAIHRQHQRGFTDSEVMAAAVAPERVLLDPVEGRRRHIRGDVLVVVNPSHKAVLTVFHANKESVNVSA